jgi:hypothetical protein
LVVDNGDMGGRLLNFHDLYSFGCSKFASIIVGKKLQAKALPLALPSSLPSFEALLENSNSFPFSDGSVLWVKTQVSGFQS